MASVAVVPVTAPISSFRLRHLHPSGVMKFSYKIPAANNLRDILSLGGRQRWIVRVDLGLRRIEATRVPRVELGLLGEARDKVGIGEGELAEADRVGAALLQRRRRASIIESFIGDIDAAERRLELWTEAVQP